MVEQVPTLEQIVVPTLKEITNVDMLRQYVEQMIQFTYNEILKIESFCALVNGRVTIDPNPPKGWVNDAAWLDFKIQTARYVEQTVPTLTATAQSLLLHTNSDYNSTIAAHFGGHAAGEQDEVVQQTDAGEETVRLGHEHQVYGDIGRGGYDLEKVMQTYPIIEPVRIYIETARDRSSNPETAVWTLGEALMLEGLAKTFAGHFAHNFANNSDHPNRNNIVEFMGAHADLDTGTVEEKGHFEKGMDLLPLIEKRDYKGLVTEVENVSLFYRQLILAVHKRILDRQQYPGLNPTYNFHMVNNG